jgi:hypothetical protein
MNRNVVQGMKRKGNMRFVAVALGIITIWCMLTGCGNEIQDESGKYIVFKFADDNIYLDEVYIYAQTTIDQYVEKYGQDIWGTAITTDNGIEMDVEEMARKEIIAGIVKTKALVSQAEGYGISLTKEEEEEQEKKADDFYNSLTDEQIAAIGMDKDTPARVLKENSLAEKVYAYVMANNSIEISDLQARMTTFYDMFFECYYEDDFGNIVVYNADKIEERKELAEAAYEGIKENLEDNPDMNITFLANTYDLPYAGNHTMNQNELLETYGQEVQEELYSMNDGDISPVIETEYGYHIFQMISLTDEKATAENKEALAKEANEEYYTNLLSNWIEELDKDYTYSKRVNEDIYNMIEFK